MTKILEIKLHDLLVGTITLLPGDRSIFTFTDEYLNISGKRPVLSQSFLNQDNKLHNNHKPTQTKILPFFSNLLPEGHLRNYLASQANINPEREFLLLEALGADLPGAVLVRPAKLSEKNNLSDQNNHCDENHNNELHFSLAGVQLKFSAIMESNGRLTIPANGIGGNWIVKLPSSNFTAVPENEWAMLHLAKSIGINVPEFYLKPLQEIHGIPELGIMHDNKALVIKRFDRDNNGNRIHIEDFAQVYNLFPNKKYGHVSYLNIATMLWKIAGETETIDFIRRLIFNIIIGNGDMHLKNWSFIYSDKYTPTLAPAYDYVATIPYIPRDKLALNICGTKDFQQINKKLLIQFATKAKIPQGLMLQVVRETIELTLQQWQANKAHFDLPKELITSINNHIENLNITKEI